MKLYTEKQLITSYNKGLREGKNNIIDTNLLYGFLPIELPSDEEIEKESSHWLGPSAFRGGAQWVIRQIKQKSIGH